MRDVFPVLSRVLGLVLLAGLAPAAQAQTLYDDVPELLDPADCAVSGGDWAERALTRSLTPQLGLPSLAHPEDNPPSAEKIRLGRKLFFDRRLSINKTMSCAMCHVPEQAFVNWELQTSVGVEGRSVKRNAPTIINVGHLTALFHDGRDPALETQFIGPIVARNEMSNPSAGHVISLLGRLPDYAPGFEAAFGAPPSLDRVGQALASYQRSVTLGNSAFDRWYFGQDEAAFSDAQRRGFEIFTGRGECSSCHLIGARDALFTDMGFHDTGYGQMREHARQNPPDTARLQIAPGLYQEVDFSMIASVLKPQEADLGRYEVTEMPEDRWKFRTPTLRNIAVTRPYMHDGALHSLAEVIAFYNEGGPATAGQDPRIRPLGLSAGEMADLEAFLEGLTSDGLACVLAEARHQPPDNH